MNQPTHPYFAFGANMATRVLVKRRGIVPTRSEAALLRGYVLRFTQRGLPLVEPAFGDIVEEASGEVHGVLHHLTSAGIARLDRLEASYRRIEVEVETARGLVAATAYKARWPRPEGIPSRRYLGLLIEGAREHGLPAHSIAALERRPSAYLPGVAEFVEGAGKVADVVLDALRPKR